MGLSKLSEKCKKCRYVNTCDHKQMEAVAVLRSPAMPPSTVSLLNTAATSLTMPVLRETININVDGANTKVYKDDIQKQLNDALYAKLGIPSSLLQRGKYYDGTL